MIVFRRRPAIGSPVALFEAVPGLADGYTDLSLVPQLVSADGMRFLFKVPAGPPSAPSMNVVLNWAGECRGQVISLLRSVGTFETAVAADLGVASLLERGSCRVIVVGAGRVTNRVATDDVVEPVVG